jgi:cyclic beta-1,2-glucan synthetase
VHYRYRETVYHITILQMSTVGGMRITLDGVPLDSTAIPLIDDRREHSVEVRIEIAPSKK